MASLTTTQRQALQLFAEAHGRQWKARLSDAWMTGLYGAGIDADTKATLQGIRNTFGPSWLATYKGGARVTESPDIFAIIETTDGGWKVGLPSTTHPAGMWMLGTFAADEYRRAVSWAYGRAAMRARQTGRPVRLVGAEKTTGHPDQVVVITVEVE